MQIAGIGISPLNDVLAAYRKQVNSTREAREKMRAQALQGAQDFPSFSDEIESFIAPVDNADEALSQQQQQSEYSFSFGEDTGVQELMLFRSMNSYSSRTMQAHMMASENYVQNAISTYNIQGQSNAGQILSTQAQYGAVDIAY